MFNVNERLNNGTRLVASFTTFDEAERYVLEHKVVCYERDADHPGCADVFLADGRLWSIDAMPDKPVEAAAGTSAADDDQGYPPPCTNPSGHEWPKVEESERCLCVQCGADEDA